MGILNTVVSGTLTVAVSPDFAPMSFIDSTKTGQDMYVGFEITMAKYIADYLGLELVIMPMDYSYCDDAVLGGSADLAIASYKWTEDREANYNLSDYYTGEYENEQVLITLAPNGDKFATAEDLVGAKIGTQNASKQQLLVETQLPDSELVLFPDLGIAVLQLKSGDFDCVAVDDVVGDAIIGTNPEIVKSGFAFHVDSKETGSIILLQKGAEDLTNVVNEALAHSVIYWDIWYADAVNRS